MGTNKSIIRPRWSKVLADLWDNKTRTLLVVASIAVGVFAIGTIANAYFILSEDLVSSYVAVNPANIEIITGDGQTTTRRKIDLTATDAFGKANFNFDVDVSGQRWLRLEVWDIATNGAFTQPIWLRQ